MNYDERRRRAMTLCNSLRDEIERVASPGLRLPECWDLVGPESAIFMELLTRWEQTGEAYLIDQVREAYDKLVLAWREAADLHESRQQDLA